MRPPEDHLDALIGRLERAGEQLRSGELSADAAATLVEECAALAARGERRARAARARRRRGRTERAGHAALMRTPPRGASGAR